MILPELKETDRYVGLYVVDFGDHSAVGFTAEEVAELLESEASEPWRVYKIHNAYPDGRLELTGLRREVFQMEAGMLFHARDEAAARDDFGRLCRLAETLPPPARAKVHLASDNSGGFVTAIIYPAEYDHEFSRWLLDGKYRTAGAVEGAAAAVNRYYDSQWNILDKKQLWPPASVKLLKGQALRDAARKAVVR